MGLNKQKGNMYDFITHTWNPLAGKCPHGCSYCSTNKFYYPVLKEKYSGSPRLVESELKTNLGNNNFIFVCAQNDLFAEEIPDDIIYKILDHCDSHINKYLFQTKNPRRILDFIYELPINTIICTTIETNRWYPEFMGNTPSPEERSDCMNELWHENGYGRIKQHVTIEPIMDFDVDLMKYYIESCLPEQVNIGADSGHNNLPEPSKAKILELIYYLEKFTKVNIKSNLKRLINATSKT